MFYNKYSIRVNFDVVSNEEIEDLLKKIKNQLKTVGQVVLVQDTHTTTWIDPGTTLPQKFDENGRRVFDEEVTG